MLKIEHASGWKELTSTIVKVLCWYPGLICCKLIHKHKCSWKFKMCSTQFSVSVGFALSDVMLTFDFWYHIHMFARHGSELVIVSLPFFTPISYTGRCIGVYSHIKQTEFYSDHHTMISQYSPPVHYTILYKKKFNLSIYCNCQAGNTTKVTDEELN